MIPEALRSLLAASRALAGTAERGLRNPPWEAAKGRVLVVRLSPFRDVDRSSAHLILLAEARASLPGAYIDLAFLPDRADRALLGAAGGLPWFFGAASGASPADFDLILVSNAFGLELLNLSRLLSTAGLPLRASSRAAETGALPILVLGGSNAGQCAALVDAAGDSLVDGLFFGEGEGAIGPLAAILADGSRPRGERLGDAASVEGFWPALHPELRARRRVLPSSPPPLLSWPLLNGPEAGTTRLQVTAGCPGYCSFCFEGWDRRPYRELPLPSLLDAARAMRARNGASTLEVYSFNFNTHEDIVELLYELGRIFPVVNVMSQRLDVLASTPGLMAAELAADKRSFTLGIEGISRRMRAYYRKGLGDGDLGRLLTLVVAPGVRELKLFYILSGFETAEDSAEFAAFAARLAALRKEAAPGLRILVSAAYLVRLPGTPLRHAPLVLDEEPFARLARPLAEACAANGLEWRIAARFDEYCVDQVLSLGGGGLLPWLEGLAGTGEGTVYDGGLGRRAWKSLEDFARRRGMFDADFLGEKDEAAAPVFPILEEGNSTRVLWNEYRRARDFVDRESCLGGHCADCGACDDAESRIFLTRHRSPRVGRADVERLARLVAAKRAFPVLHVLVERPPSLAGALVATQEAWLLGRLASGSPEAWRQVFSTRLAFPLPGGSLGIPEGAVGRAAFTLRGPSTAGLRELAEAAGLVILETAPEPTSAKLRIDFPAYFREAAGFAAARRGTGDPTEPGALLAAWLLRSRHAFTERREGEGRHYEIAARDRGKKIVFAARSGADSIQLELGPRASVAELLAPLGARLSGLPLVTVLEWSP